MLHLNWQKDIDFELFYRQWVAFIYNVAYRIAGSHVEAEDLVQETFIRVFRFIKNFRGGSIKSWLYRIVINISYTTLQKNKIRHINETPLEGTIGEDTLMEELPDKSGDPCYQIDYSQMSDTIQSAINSLPFEQKTILVLSDVEGLSYKEISDIAGCPVGTVRSRLSRARQMFIQAMKLIEKSEEPKLCMK